MKPEEILRDEFEKLKQHLIKKHDELGMRASGKWASTLDNRSFGLSGKLFGQQYTEQLAFGRKPGKFPPIATIEKWIEDKGIKPINDRISVSSFAFLIARKIAEQGTEYFKQGGTDLIDSVITPQRIQSIIDKVSVFYVNDFILNVTNELQKLAA